MTPRDDEARCAFIGLIDKCDSLESDPVHHGEKCHGMLPHAFLPATTRKEA